MRFDRLAESMHELRQQIRERWSKITDSDLRNLGEGFEGLAAVVAKRYSISTKQARADVAEFAEQVGTSFREAARAIGDAARELWRDGRNRVAGAVHHGSERASDLLHAGRDRVVDLRSKADHAIQARPLTSVAIAAGVGALMGFLLRGRSS